MFGFGSASFRPRRELLVGAAADGSEEHRKPLTQLVIRVYRVGGLHFAADPA